MAVTWSELKPPAEPVEDGDRSAGSGSASRGFDEHTYGALMESGLLGGLSAEEQRAVVASMVRRSYRKDETLFHEGDPGESLLIVERGRVAIRTSTPLGDVATLAILGRGDSFGEQALIDASAVRTASAVALETVEVRSLHRRQFDELRETYPSVNRLLVELLAAQVRRLSAHLLDALYLPVEQRVVRRLRDLAELYDGGDFPDRDPAAPGRPGDDGRHDPTDRQPRAAPARAGRHHRPPSRSGPRVEHRRPHGARPLTESPLRSTSRRRNWRTP